MPKNPVIKEYNTHGEEPCDGVVEFVMPHPLNAFFQTQSESREYNPSSPVKNSSKITAFKKELHQIHFVHEL